MRIDSHRDLHVWQDALEGAMGIFQLSKDLPKEERYALTDQIRRSSRSVAANISEAWMKRRYEAAFLLKLNDAQIEAAETLTWLEIAGRCGYFTAETIATMTGVYEAIIAQLISMSRHPEKWVIRTTPKQSSQVPSATSAAPPGHGCAESG